MRDGIGELFYISDDDEVHNRMMDARPIPVYSCWDGMIALDARPFMGLRFDEEYKSGVWSVGKNGKFKLNEKYANEKEEEHVNGTKTDTESGMTERNEKQGTKRRQPVRFRGAMRDKQECAASECKLIAKDFWKRHFDRWVVSCSRLLLS